MTLQRQDAGIFDRDGLAFPSKWAETVAEARGYSADVGTKRSRIVVTFNRPQKQLRRRGGFIAYDSLGPAPLFPSDGMGRFQGVRSGRKKVHHQGREAASYA